MLPTSLLAFGSKPDLDLWSCGPTPRLRFRLPQNRRNDRKSASLLMKFHLNAILICMDLPYQAVLLVSFGGPEGMDDVLPFLQNVLKGRPVSAERFEEVAHHYEIFGGVSPINEQNRQLLTALQRELESQGLSLPLYCGNRNWHPLLADTVRQMSRDGIKKSLAFVTSPYSSYSGCRQYLQDIDRARIEVGPEAPVIHKLRAFYNHPGFVEANADRVREALSGIPAERRQKVTLVFTAHSVPVSMAAGCRYVEQLQEVCGLVAEQVAHPIWSLAYQSRSGRPEQAWLEPDVGDYLQELKSSGARDVVIVPVGFVSDHMEVVYDLDVEAMQLCKEIGLNAVRASSAGAHPAFVGMVRELILERVQESPERRFLGKRGPRPDFCPIGCCSASRRMQHEGVTGSFDA